MDTISGIWAAVTYNCNNKCSWCYANSNSISARRRVMSLEDYKLYLNLFYELGLRNVTLIGGEPTVHPQIIEMTRYAADKGLSAGIVTNGRKLSDESFCQKIYDSGIKHVTISIESYSEIEHDATTQAKGSFKETLKGLENMLAYPVGVSSETTISRINYDNAEKIAEYLSTTGLKRLGFNICTPCLANQSNSNDTLTPKEGADIISSIYKVLKEKDIAMESITPLPKCLFEHGIFDEMDKKKILHKSCHMLYGNRTVIDYNGNILPCVHFSGKPTMNLKKGLGVMTKLEFLEAYNDTNGKPYKFRDKMWYYPGSKCANNCAWFGTDCIAGCPIFWYKYNPEEELL